MKGIEQFVQVDAATLGALKYAGTWNASTNTPTLASGVGVQGQYYVVSVAGTTNLDGVTNWGVGDWAVFNGTVWQRVEGGADGNFVNLSVTGTATVSGTAEFADGLAASPSITNIGDTNTGMYFPSADAIGIVTGGVNRIRVTSAGDVGIGTTSPASKLDVNGTVTATGATVTGNTYLATTSGDVGIGTSSPGAKLHSLATTNPAIFASSDATALFTTYQYNTSTVCGYIGNGAGVVTGAGASNFGVRAENSLVFAAGGNNERMRLDSAGNLGLGVTPSAWSTQNAIEFSYGAFSAGTAIGTLMASNAFYNGTNWIYRISSAAMRYTQDSAGHSWFTAPFGTSGNTISFTQAMTLDASGDFIVGGTTTNSIRLTAEKSNPSRGIIAHVSNAGSSSLTGSQIMFTQNTVNNWAVGQPAGVDAFAFWSSRNTAADGTERMRIDSAGNLGLGVTPSAWSATSRAIQLAASSSLEGRTNDGSHVALYSNAIWDGTNFIYQNTATAAYYKQSSATHSWYTAGAGTAGNAISFTQAMTLDASGNLLVGTTSNAESAKLNVQGGYIFLKETNGGDVYLRSGFGAGTDPAIQVSSNDPLLFVTNNTERARIDASGNLLVGKTTASGTTVGPELLANGQINAATADLDNLNIYNTTATAYRFYVNAAGTVFATNTTISAISDQRLKENVQDLDAGLDKIMALKPRKFDWKAGKGKDIKGDRGFIAQEFEQVFPDLIDEWKDPALEGEEPYKSVRQDLIPVLVKAIQELKAEVDSLKAQLGA